MVLVEWADGHEEEVGPRAIEMLKDVPLSALIR